MLTSEVVGVLYKEVHLGLSNVCFSAFYAAAAAAAAAAARSEVGPALPEVSQLLRGQLTPAQKPCRRASYPCRGSRRRVMRIKPGVFSHRLLSLRAAVRGSSVDVCFVLM